MTEQERDWAKEFNESEAKIIAAEEDVSQAKQRLRRLELERRILIDQWVGRKSVLIEEAKCDG